MKLAPVELRRPQNLDEALDYLARLGSDGQVLAGGQSLIPLLRYRMADPYVLIDINGVAELDVLEVGTAIQIGALVRHQQMEALAQHHEASKRPLLRFLGAHAAEIAFRPVRARGTVVGSLVHADPLSDWLLCLLALNAEMQLQSKRGQRTVPLHEFVSAPLQAERLVDELAVAVTIPADHASPMRCGRKKMMRRTGDFALSAAVALQYASGWRCWAALANEIPLSLTKTAAWLDKQGAQVAPAALMAQARDEIETLMPELDLSQRSLHAAVLADAVLAALAEPAAAAGGAANSAEDSALDGARPQGGNHA